MKVPLGKLQYYEESDVLYYLISEGEEDSAIELAPGLTVELNKEKEIIGLVIGRNSFLRFAQGHVYVLRITFYVSRITHHVSRLT